MNGRTFVHSLLVIMTAVAISALAGAQQQDAQVDKVIESVRADMRADKVAIVTEVMNLSPSEAEKFWPVYREYETKVAELNDQRIAMLKEYAAKYGSLTDAEARQITEKFFAWEDRRSELRKSYFQKFLKATSGTTAAKFFQVEHRLDLLVDLRLAAEVPALFVKPAAVQP